jgi:glycosyltransferase involved in cell wall biosynthesis
VKITVLTNLVPPYRFDAYGALHHHAVAAGGGLSVICSQRTEPQRNWPRKSGAFEHLELRGLQVPLGANRLFSLPFNLRRTVRATSPSVLILNGFGIAQWQAQNDAIAHAIPTILQFDGWIGSDKVYANPVRQKMRQSMISRANGFVAASTGGADWFEGMGAPRNCISIAPIPASFRAPKPVKRQSFQPTENRDFDLLWCGRTTLSKGFDTFLRVASALRQSATAQKIAILGSTNMDATTAALRSHALTECIDLFPQLSPDDLPALLTRAKLCLFPSLNDAYGVGVIDAIACGAVALASPMVGCSPDVLAPGEIIPTEQTAMWTERCEALLNDPALLEETRAAQVLKIAPNNATDHANTLWQTALSLVEHSGRACA